MISTKAFKVIKITDEDIQTLKNICLAAQARITYANGENSQWSNKEIDAMKLFNAEILTEKSKYARIPERVGFQG